MRNHTNTTLRVALFILFTLLFGLEGSGMTFGKIGARKMMTAKTYDWCKPVSWPDIEAALVAYPIGASDAESNALAIMFDLTSVSEVRLKCGTSYRFSDSTDSLEIVANKTTTISHTFPSGTEYGWVIAYASDSVFVNGSQHVNTLLKSTTDKLSTTPVKWIVGRNFAEARISGMRGVEAASFQTSVLDNTIAHFQSVYNLKYLNFSKNVEFSSPVSFQAFLSQCYSLKSVSADRFNMANVYNAVEMFADCYCLRDLDVSRWDVSSVVSFSGIFRNCYSLSRLDVGGWDVSSATSIQALFSGCLNLSSLDVSRWNVSSCTNAAAVFNGCRSLASIDVSSWNTSSFTNLDSMFNGCISLESIDISGWDIGSVVSMNGCFDSCYVLKSLIGKKVVMQDGSINGHTNYFGKGPNANFNISACEVMMHDSLVFLMYFVPSVSGQTMTLGDTNKAKLTSAEISIAEAKGWTVA